MSSLQQWSTANGSAGRHAGLRSRSVAGIRCGLSDSRSAQVLRLFPKSVGFTPKTGRMFECLNRRRVAAGDAATSCQQAPTEASVWARAAGWWGLLVPGRQCVVPVRGRRGPVFLGPDACLRGPFGACFRSGVRAIAVAAYGHSALVGRGGRRAYGPWVGRTWPHAATVMNHLVLRELGHDSHSTWIPRSFGRLQAARVLSRRPLIRRR